MLPISAVVQSFYDDNDFLANVSKYRDREDEASIFSSPAFETHNQLLGGAFNSDREIPCIPFELGGDGVQVCGTYLPVH